MRLSPNGNSLFPTLPTTSPQSMHFSRIISFFDINVNSQIKISSYESVSFSGICAVFENIQTIFIHKIIFACIIGRNRDESESVMNMNEKSRKVFTYLSLLMNTAPDCITAELMDGGDEITYAAYLAAFCGLDTDSPEGRELYRKYFISMVHRLDPDDFENDPFYKNIVFPETDTGVWQFRYMTCKAYEMFVCGDPAVLSGGTVIPKIGYFERDFRYPAVLENGREWMTLMPNETLTTLPSVDKCKGKVLTFGLGLGYFTYMASIKPEVSSVTVVERDESVIKMFKEHILPQFPNKDKINIVHSDAFEFADKHISDGWDHIFADIWHDPSDGCELYLRFKEYEKNVPEGTFSYWIEDTIKLYL